MAVQQLSMVTQQNASSSEEMAGGSEEMAAQAADLERITQFFKIDNRVDNSWKQQSYAKKDIKSKGHINTTKQSTSVQKSNIEFNLSGLESDITGYEAM